MSDAPAMPLFLDAYLADTTHLSTEEHGAYLLLLMAMWRRNGTVPNDDRDLARIVGMESKKWLQTKKRLASLLQISKRSITQKRLLKEWGYVQEKKAKNSANGSKGGRPKSNINNRLDKANGSVLDNPNESPHNPEPIPIEKPNGFSTRARREKPRPKGWVSPRTTTKAAATLCQEIDNDFGRTQGGNALTGETVLQLSAVRTG